jgi:hypothetical protein
MGPELQVAKTNRKAKISYIIIQRQLQVEGKSEMLKQM